MKTALKTFKELTIPVYKGESDLTVALRRSRDSLPAFISIGDPWSSLLTFQVDDIDAVINSLNRLKTEAINNGLLPEDLR